MAKQKVKIFSPREEDIAIVGVINKEFNMAFSVEKSVSGFYVVRYSLNERLEGLKHTIRYKRLNTNESDSKKNRVVFSNQNEAEMCMIDSYKEVFNYLKSK